MVPTTRSRDDLPVTDAQACPTSPQDSQPSRGTEMACETYGSAGVSIELDHFDDYDENTSTTSDAFEPLTPSETSVSPVFPYIAGQWGDGPSKAMAMYKQQLVNKDSARVLIDERTIRDAAYDQAVNGDVAFFRQQLNEAITAVAHKDTTSEGDRIWQKAAQAFAIQANDYFYSHNRFSVSLFNVPLLFYRLDQLGGLTMASLIRDLEIIISTSDEERALEASESNSVSLAFLRWIITSRDGGDSANLERLSPRCQLLCGVKALPNVQSLLLVITGKGAVNGSDFATQNVIREIAPTVCDLFRSLGSSKLRVRRSRVSTAPPELCDNVCSRVYFRDVSSWWHWIPGRDCETEYLALSEASDFDSLMRLQIRQWSLHAEAGVSHAPVDSSLMYFDS